MKHLLYLFLLLLTSCTSSNTPLKNDEVVTKDNEVSLKTDDNDLIDHVKTDSIFITCRDTIIKFISYHDAEERTETYHKDDSINNPFLHIVYAEYYESRRTFIINKLSGKLDTIWAKPIFSPNKSQLIAISPDSPYEGANHGYQLWKADKTGLWNKTKEVNQKKWHPMKVEWLNDSLIELQVASMNLDEWEIATVSYNEKDILKIKI